MSRLNSQKLNQLITHLAWLSIPILIAFQASAITAPITQVSQASIANRPKINTANISNATTATPMTQAKTVEEQTNPMTTANIIFTPEQLKQRIQEARLANEQWRTSKTEWFNDYAELNRYATDNIRIQNNKKYPEIIFIGDSIFDHWNLISYFPSQAGNSGEYVNRGISGQVSGQVLLRFRDDVLNNQPKRVIIEVGTNDIAGNLGVESLQTMQNNIKAMLSLAKMHGVEVILASILPVHPYNKDAELNFVLRPVDKIIQFNKFLQQQAQTRESVSYLDINTPLRDDSGMLAQSYSDDGLHPNQEAYQIIADTLTEHLDMLQKEVTTAQAQQTALAKKITDNFGSLTKTNSEDKISGFTRILPPINTIASRELVTPEDRKAAQEALLKWRVENKDRVLLNFADLEHYAKNNQQLSDSRNYPKTIFFGDSIFAYWDLTKSYPNQQILNRGIEAQTTSQLLLRFNADVINNKPQTVIMLAGVNDLAGNTGPITLKTITENIASIAEIAKANNIRIVLSSLLPIRSHTDANEYIYALVNSDDIVKLNKWIQMYCHDNGLVYLNFYDAMVDNEGMIKAALVKEDGLHPNNAGYQVMQNMINQTLGF